MRSLPFTSKLELVVDAVRTNRYRSLQISSIVARSIEAVVLFLRRIVLDRHSRSEIAVAFATFVFIRDPDRTRGETHIIVIVEALPQVDLLVVLIQYLDVQAECLQFLDKNA